MSIRDRTSTGVPRAGGTPATRRCVAPALVGIACAAIAVLAALAAGLLDRSRPLTFGHDLLPSYVAGRLVLDGRGGDMYDPAACEQLGRRMAIDANLTNDPRHVRWLNPGFFALLFAPLAALPYRVALLAWLLLNAGLAGATLCVIGRWARGRRRRLLLAAAVVTSCPFLLALEHQQNTFVSLALVAGAAAAWRADRLFVAGLLAGLLAYKPQLAAVLGVALLAAGGRRALAGLLVSGVGLLLAGEWAAPGSTVGFLTAVPKIVAAYHDLPGFNWGRQVTPRSFWRVLLGPGTSASVLGYACSAAAVAGVAAVAFSLRGGRPGDGDRATNRDVIVSMAVIALPLSAPYFMDYDLLLLAVPAALALSADRLPRHAAALWLLLWPAAYLNVDAVAVGGVGLVVPLLAALLPVTWAAANLGRRGRSDTMPGREAPASPPRRLAA